MLPFVELHAWPKIVSNCASRIIIFHEIVFSNGQRLEDLGSM